MNYTMCAVSVLSLSLLNACGSKGSTSALSSAQYAAAIQGSWDVTEGGCIILDHAGSSSSSVFNSGKLVASFTASSGSVTTTYYSDTACSVPSESYVTSANYSIVGTTPAGDGVLINTSAETSATITPFTTAAVNELNSLNAAGIQTMRGLRCTATFAVNIASDVHGQICELESSISHVPYRTSSSAAYYSAGKIDTSFSPVRYYGADEDATHDGSTEAKRATSFTSGTYITKR